MALIPLIIMLGLMWLLLIRPQRQQVQRHHAFVSSLSVGDEVLTAGGVYGTITALDGRDARVEIAPGVEVRVLAQRLLAVPPAAGIDDDDDETAAGLPAAPDDQEDLT